MIYYLNQSPSKTGKGMDHKRSLSPIPMDHQKLGVFGDRIYNAHNSSSKFYVVTFGYAKAWKKMDVYDRQIDRYTIHFDFRIITSWIDLFVKSSDGFHMNSIDVPFTHIKEHRRQTVFFLSYESSSFKKARIFFSSLETLTCVKDKASATCCCVRFL